MAEDKIVITGRIKSMYWRLISRNTHSPKLWGCLLFKFNTIY